MPDPLMRLVEFRRAHPDVVIAEADFGSGWDAQVPLPAGEQGYFKPRPLDILLDVLEEELDTGPP